MIRSTVARTLLCYARSQTYNILCTVDAIYLFILHRACALYLPGEPESRDYFIIEIFRELSASHAKFDVHKIARLMDIYMVLVSLSI